MSHDYLKGLIGQSQVGNIKRKEALKNKEAERTPTEVKTAAQPGVENPAALSGSLDAIAASNRAFVGKPKLQKLAFDPAELDKGLEALRESNPDLVAGLQGMTPEKLGQLHALSFAGEKAGLSDAEHLAMQDGFVHEFVIS